LTQSGIAYPVRVAHGGDHEDEQSPIPWSLVFIVPKSLEPAVVTFAMIAGAAKRARVVAMNFMYKRPLSLLIMLSRSTPSYLKDPEDAGH
jgi:hypothetical protein